MNTESPVEETANFCVVKTEELDTEEKVNYMSNSCSVTVTDSCTIESLSQVRRDSHNNVSCISGDESMSMASLDTNNLKILEESEKVIDVAEGPEVGNNVNLKIGFESSSSQSENQNPTFEANSVNSNYFVLVGSSDGSQVISRVIPNILSSGVEQPQLALNAVLPSDISYIRSASNLDQGKEEADFSTNSVTMVLDSSLHTQDSQKIFLDPSSLISIESQTIGPEHLAVIEKTAQEFGSAKNILLHSNSPTITHTLHTSQFASQIGDGSAQSQLKVFNEIENNVIEDQRLKNLRHLEQSHREHQDKLLNRRNKKQDEESDNDGQFIEELLRNGGIDDTTPVFSFISAKINPSLLKHVPGCQKFLLHEAANNRSSSEITFASELDCTFKGNIKDFVSLHSHVKSLLGLRPSTDLIFQSSKDGSTQQNKSISCNLLVPYVSSKGRVSKQSSQVMQMGGLIGEYLSGDDIGEDRNEGRRRKRNHRKRLLPNRTRYNMSQKQDLNPSEENLLQFSQLIEDKSLIPSGINKSIEETAFNKNTVKDSQSDVMQVTEDVTDPVLKRLLEEQIKCKQIYEDNNKLKQLKTVMVSQHHKQFTDVTAEGTTRKPASEDNSLCLPANHPRRNKGRPPKKFDPSELIQSVKPRNPLTEADETKQRRHYEKNVAYKFFCDQCSFKSKRPSQFAHHLRVHAKGTEVKYSCRHCDFVSISIVAFKRHQLMHKKKVLKCDICNVYITDKKSLMQKHIRLKHSAKAAMALEKKFSCPECAATFTNRIALRKHKTTHSKEPSELPIISHICPQCKKPFQKKIHLTRHLRDVHGPQQRPHLCDKCGWSFKRKDALQQHKIVHIARSARVLPYKCNKCDKAFRSQAHLKEHSTMHSTERPYLCQYCGSSFKTQPVQKKHILTLHIQPRTHVCSVCCRQFNTKNALQRHENTHKSASDPMVVDEGIRPWEDENESIKIEMKDSDLDVPNNEIVSLEGEAATTALVVEAEGGAQVMVDTSLVPAIIASGKSHSASGTNRLQVQQTLIQNSQAEQAFYYLTDEQLQTIQ